MITILLHILILFVSHNFVGAKNKKKKSLIYGKVGAWHHITLCPLTVNFVISLVNIVMPSLTDHVMIC